MIAGFLPVLAAAGLPVSLGPAWAEFSRDPQLMSVETRIEIGTRGYDRDRGRLDFWLRRTVTTLAPPVVTWADSRQLPGGVGRARRDARAAGCRFAPIGVSEGPPMHMEGIPCTLRTYSDEGEIAVGHCCNNQAGARPFA